MLGKARGFQQTWQDARWAPKPNRYFSEEAPAWCLGLLILPGCDLVSGRANHKGRDSVRPPTWVAVMLEGTGLVKGSSHINTGP